MEELAECMNKQHRKCYANDVNDEQLIPMFRQWAIANFCMENMDFYVAVSKYRHADPANMKQEAEAVFRKFIAIGAPQEVNINYLIRVHIMREMVEPKAELFDEAQAHIFELMQVDCFPRFFRSEPFVSRYKPIPASLPDALSPKGKVKGPPPMMQDNRSRASSLKTFLKRAVRPTSSDFTTRMYRSQSAVDAREGVAHDTPDVHDATSDWRETLRATLRSTLRSTRQSRAFTVPTPIPEENAGFAEASGRVRAHTDFMSPPMSPPTFFSPPLSPVHVLPFSPHGARMSMDLPQGAHHRHSKSEPFVIPKGLRTGVVIIGHERYDRDRRKAREFNNVNKEESKIAETAKIEPRTELSSIPESSTTEPVKVESSLARSIVECILESIIESVDHPKTEKIEPEKAETEKAAAPAIANDPTADSDSNSEPGSNGDAGSGSESSGSDGSSSSAHVDASLSASSSKTSVSDYGYSSNTDSGSYGYSSSAKSSTVSISSHTETTTPASASFVPYTVETGEGKEEGGKKSRFSKMFHGKLNFLFHHKSPTAQIKSSNRRRHSTALYMQNPQNNTKLGAQLSLITSPPAMRKRRARET